MWAIAVGRTEKELERGIGREFDLVICSNKILESESRKRIKTVPDERRRKNERGFNLEFLRINDFNVEWMFNQTPTRAMERQKQKNLKKNFYSINIVRCLLSPRVL